MYEQVNSGELIFIPATKSVVAFKTGSINVNSDGWTGVFKLTKGEYDKLCRVKHEVVISALYDTCEGTLVCKGKIDYYHDDLFEIRITGSGGVERIKSNRVVRE